MQFTAFEDSDVLAKWLADHVAVALAKAIEKKGKASLVVSGGSTPGKFFKALANKEIEWENVSVCLADERCVPRSSNRSNTRMITLELLQNRAAKAHLVPLYDDEGGIEKLSELEAEIRSLLPFDVVILGMGNDGHTASLFPGADNLGAATQKDSKRVLLAMNAPGAEEPRVTLSCSALTSAENIILHIEGDKKRETLDLAREAGDPAKMPIRYVLERRADLRVIWAP
jgi:6-phosphogluconolactonase